MNMFKKNGGFTLVELIVVIAILAILAGVAVPAYSGYITRAQEAADTQVLSAMNTAFAAACVENGVRPADMTDGTVTVTVTDKKVAAIDVPTTEVAGTDVSANIESDFNTYFGENKNTVLKYYTSFNFTAGNFVGVEPTT